MAILGNNETDGVAHAITIADKEYGGPGVVDKRAGASWTAIENGEITSISGYFRSSFGSNTVSITAFINSTDSGGSGTHAELAKKELTNVSVGTSSSWTTFTLDTPISMTKDSKYLINFSCDASTIDQEYDWVLLIIDQTKVYDAYGEDQTYGSEENPWVGDAFSEYEPCCYITYTPTTKQLTYGSGRITSSGTGTLRFSNE